MTSLVIMFVDLTTLDINSFDQISNFENSSVSEFENNSWGLDIVHFLR